MSSRTRSTRSRNLTQKAKDYATVTRGRGRPSTARQAPYRPVLPPTVEEPTEQAFDSPLPLTGEQPQQQDAVTQMLGQVLDRLSRLEETAASPPEGPHQSLPPAPTYPGNNFFQQETGFLDTPSDTEFARESLVRPVQHYGSLVGQDIKKKLVADIRADKFVEFWELLPNANRHRKTQFCLEATSSSDLTIVQKRQRRFISFQDWLKAYDAYMAVYIDTAPSREALLMLTKDMLTYKKDVTGMYDAAGDWFSFDEHFRMDREVNPCRFSTVRHDLIRQYENKTRQPFRDDAKRPVGGLRKQYRQPGAQRSASKIPLGFCRNYHRQETRCDERPCKFKHTCPNCRVGNDKHPLYLCKSSRPQVPAPGSQRPVPP